MASTASRLCAPDRLFGSLAADRYLYRRQFVAGPKPLPLPSDWQHVTFGNLLEVYVHPDLSWDQAVTGQGDVLILGDIFDPGDPSATGQDIAQGLARQAVSFDAFEAALAGLGGRYLAFVRSGDEARVYPDAAALQTLFYLTGDREEGVLGSQPGVINEFVTTRWQEDIAGIKRPGHFAFSLTPYEHIRPLLPNHYLDLRNRQTVRFWPKDQLTPLELSEAAQEMGRLLVGTVSAIAARGRSFLPLSGGRDCRMLLAAYLAAGICPQTATFRAPFTPHYEFAIPRRLSRRLKFPHKTIRIVNPPKTLLDTYKANTGAMFWDPSSISIETGRRAYADFDYIVNGVVSEVVRSRFHPTDRATAVLSAESICAATGFEETPMVLEAIDRWLSGVREFHRTVNAWDLLHWEQRLGNWASLSATGRDTVSRAISPFNNRRILEAGLRAPAEVRVAPYALVTRICEILCPDVLAEPFNTSTYDRVMASLWTVLPYKVRRACEVGTWAINGLDEARRIREGARR